MTSAAALVLGAFELASGFGILGWWAAEWASHGKGAALAFGVSHIAAELMAFGVLILGGVSLLAGVQGAKPLATVGLGMLLYATVNAFGRVGGRSRRVTAAMVAETIVGILLVVALIEGY